MKKLTTAEFIAKAQTVHGLGKYDYSQTKYYGGNTNVIIECQKHGAFAQAPSTHLSGSGCLKCAVKIRGRYPAVDTAGFVERAKAIHNGRYAYERTVYQNGVTKLVITCLEHGDFSQRPGQHLLGKGCALCANKTKILAAQAAVRKWDTASVRIRAKELHPSLDFSQFEYLGNDVQSTVSCSKHGSFLKSPHYILAGRGCLACWREIIGKANAKGTAHYLALARAIHGDRYDYSLLNGIIRNADKIQVGCAEHGVFTQSVDAHIRGQGCPQCAAAEKKLTWSELAKGRVAILYFLKMYNGVESFYKVGITFNSVEKRYRPSNLGGYQYEILAEHKSTNAVAVYDWEQSILESFAHLKYRPKNYFAGETECFASCEEILEIFPL